MYSRQTTSFCTRRKRKKANLALAFLIQFGALVALLSTHASAEWFTDERELMGTSVSVEIWLTEDKDHRKLIDQAFREIQRLDLLLNPWNPESELARINREASQQPVKTHPEIMQILLRAQHYSDLSQGAFDISFASVGQHYDYRERKRPKKTTLEQSLDKIDYRAIKLNTEKGEVHFQRDGLQIDLGGIAKGYAVDRAIAILQRAGIQAALVSAGGDSRMLEGSPGKPRVVGIRHPRKKGEFVALLPLENTAVSTSGDYERYFEKNGVRYHHILDTSTGHSASGMQSATVLAPLAIDSDALSTTVFVLGVERGLALINQIDETEAILIDAAGKLHYSEGLLRHVQQ